MNIFRIPEVFYACMKGQRSVVLGTVLALCIVCGIGIRHMHVQEDIGMMLPTNPPELQKSLKLMGMSPFARMIFVQLEDTRTDLPALRAVAGNAEFQDSKSMLLSSANHIRNELPVDTFTCLQFDDLPSPSSLTQLLPVVASHEVMQQIEQQISPQNIHEQMRRNYVSLTGISGMFTKQFIRTDPLGFLQPVYDRLKSMRLVDGVKIAQGHLLSADEHKLLLMINTPVTSTDSGGAAKLYRTLQDVLDASLQSGMVATVFSGHRYALENAQTIKSDLVVVMGVSIVGILAIFLSLVRERSIFWVALAPGVVLLISTGFLQVTQPVVSGITLGFGAVILGISVDFALHVYFALRSGTQSIPQALTEVARPVFFGGATSLAAFAALGASSIPGIQQLAILGSVGLVVGMMLALLVLPHCLLQMCPAASAVDDTHCQDRKKRVWNRFAAVATIALLCILLGYGSSIQVDSHLRSLSVRPASLTQAEQTIRSNWGAGRDSAIFFAEGQTLDQALLRAESVGKLLKAAGSNHTATSLVSLLPSSEAQANHISNWSAFMRANSGTIASALERERQALGFSQNAFAPFFEWFENAPEPVTLEGVNDMGLGSVTSLLHATDGRYHYALTLLPDSRELQNSIKNTVLPEGVTLYSPSELGRSLSKAIAMDFKMFVATAFVAMIGLMLLYFKNIKFALLALLPLTMGIGVLLFVMRLLAQPFTLFSVAALPLIIGLAADYGIFMVSSCVYGYEHNTAKAVLVSGLTTLAGFGALVCASHPAMHSLGVTVLLGVGAAIPSALFLIPAIYRRAG